MPPESTLSSPRRPNALSRAPDKTACGAGDRSRHWQVLSISMAVALLSVSLQVLPDERVAFRGLTQFPLPPSCMSRELFGVRCPGCGLTRSFVHLAHGQWRPAFQVHRLGWLLAVILILQAPYRVALLCGLRPWFTPRQTHWLGVLLLVFFLGNWCWETIAG